MKQLSKATFQGFHGVVQMRFLLSTSLQVGNVEKTPQQGENSKQVGENFWVWFLGSFESFLIL